MLIHGDYPRDPLLPGVVGVPFGHPDPAEAEKARRDEALEAGRDECVHGLTDLVRELFPAATVDDGSSLDDVCEGIRDGVERLAGENTRLRAALDNAACLLEDIAAARDPNYMQEVALTGGAAARAALSGVQV